MKWIPILFLFFLPPPSQAEIYKCVDERGKTAFSQLPCGENAEVVTVKTVEPETTANTGKDASEKRDEYLESLDERSKRLKKRKLENQLNNLIGSRDALAGKRDKEIAKLQKDLRDAYDFREKAVIESKIQQVRDRYWDKRRRLNDKIHDKRMELAVCCD